MSLTYLQFSPTSHWGPAIASDPALKTIALTFSTLTRTSCPYTTSAFILQFKHQRGGSEMLLILELTRSWLICKNVF